MTFEPPKKEHPSSVTEQPKPRRDKSADYTSACKTSRQHCRGDSSEIVNGINQHDSRHHKDTEILPERRGSSHEKRTKQHQRQSSVSGNESGDVKSLRHRKDKGSIQPENTSEAPNEMKTKQHRRHSSGTGSDLAKVRQEQSHKTSDVSAEKPDSISEKTKKDEQHHRSLVRTKSLPKGARRSGSRNSLKSIPAENLGEIGLTEKQTGSKSKQVTRKEEGGSNIPSGRNSRKASCADDETSEQPGNENEVR
jgi:hypothetical protein